MIYPLFRNKKFLAGIVCLFIIGGAGISLNVAVKKRTIALEAANKAFADNDFLTAELLYKDLIRVPLPPYSSALAGLLNTFGLQINRNAADIETKAAPYLKRAELQPFPGKDLLNAIGYLLESEGRYRDAAAFYKKAVARDPKNGESWVHLGHAYEFAGDVSASQDAYQKAYESDPANPFVLIARGRSLMSGGEFRQARDVFLVAAKNTEFSFVKAEAFAAASSAEYAAGNFANVKPTAMRALDADDGYAPGHVAYGLGLALGGNLVEGTKEIYEGIRLSPDMTQGYWTMGIVLRSAGYFKESAEYLQNGIGRIDRDLMLVGPQAKKRALAQMTYDLAKTYDMQGSDDKALPLLKQAIGLDENLRSYLANDFQTYHFFRVLASNGRFISLLPK